MNSLILEIDEFIFIIPVFRMRTLVNFFETEIINYNRYPYKIYVIDFILKNPELNQGFYF